MEVLVWAYKHSRESARRMPIYRGEFTENHPQFPKGSAAATKENETGPVPMDTPVIKYTAEDDEAIRTAVKKFGELSSFSELLLFCDKCRLTGLGYCISCWLLALHGHRCDEAKRAGRCCELEAECLWNSRTQGRRSLH